MLKVPKSSSFVALKVGLDVCTHTRLKVERTLKNTVSAAVWLVIHTMNGSPLGKVVALPQNKRRLELNLGAFVA